MKHRFGIFLFAISSLFVGTFIYVINRSEKIFLNRLFAADPESPINSLRSYFAQSGISDWFTYTLPDGLWMLSLTIIVLLIWDFKIDRRSLPWIVPCISIGIFTEVLQAFHLVRGTFDTSDLLIMLLAAISPILLTLLRKTSCKTL